MQTADTDSPAPTGSCEDSGRQVIARAASLLRALETAPGGLTIAGLTRTVGLPRTTVTRLVQALSGEHLLVAVDGRVRLGPALARLAAAASRDVVALVRPHAEALSREVRETVDLWVERADAVELVDEVASDQEVRIVLAPGTRFPLATTAPGRAFLAGLDAGARAARLAGLTFPAGLPVDLAEIGRTGLAIDLEDHAADVCALAMVVDVGQADRHALAIAAPARRFREKRPHLEAALRACVQAIGS